MNKHLGDSNDKLLTLMFEMFSGIPSVQPA